MSIAYIPFVAAYNAPKPSPRFFAIHAAGFVLFAAAHSSLMIGSRIVLYPLFGWGDYQFGHSALRLPMEWHKDVLAYVLLATTFLELLPDAAALPHPSEVEYPLRAFVRALEAFQQVAALRRSIAAETASATALAVCPMKNDSRLSGSE